MTNNLSFAEEHEGDAPKVWQAITSARKHGSDRWKDGPKIDILAKRWVMDTDKFEYRRFVDCVWDRNDNVWTNVAEGWLPVAWMPIPKIPDSYPF